MNSVSRMVLANTFSIHVILQTHLGQHLPVDDPDYEKNKAGHIARHEFLAMLSADNLPNLDFRARAGPLLCRTTEETPWDPNSVTAAGPVDDWDPKERAGNQVSRLDVDVPACLSWFQTCAGDLYDMADHTDAQPMRWEDGDRLTNWTGPKGWSLERWAYWRRRFEEIADMEVLKPETREMARKCVVKM
jgi:hypothetical protein